MRNRTTIDRLKEIVADCLGRHQELLETARRAAADFCEGIPVDIIKGLLEEPLASRGGCLALPRGYFLTRRERQILGGKSGRKVERAEMVMVLGWRDDRNPKAPAYLFNPPSDYFHPGIGEGTHRLFALQFATDLASGWLREVATMFAGLRDEAVRAKGVLESAMPDIDALSKS